MRRLFFAGCRQACNHRQYAV